MKIATALGVTVEYLVTGKDCYNSARTAPMPEDLRLMLEVGGQLSSQKRRVALELMKTLKELTFLS